MTRSASLSLSHLWLQELNSVRHEMLKYKEMWEKEQRRAQQTGA